MEEKFKFDIKKHGPILLILLAVVASAAFLLPGGDRGIEDEPEIPPVTPDSTPGTIDNDEKPPIEIDDDEKDPVQEPTEPEPVIYAKDGKSGSSRSSSPSTSPDVSRTLTGSGDYTEPTGTITGDLTITGDITGTITLPVGLTVNGNLNVNTPGATVTNRANVGGTINIIAVSVNTWNQYGNASSIQMGAPGATFNFFSGNITQGISLTNPCYVVIDVNATGLPVITVTEDAEGSDVDNQGTEELNLTTQANITVAGNVNTTATGEAIATERVSTPIANPASGSYIGTQNVVLTTATSGATIYYTIDGSVPTSGSTLYVGALSITESKTIKAVAIKESLIDSSVVELVYVITVPVTSITVTGAGDSTEVVNGGTLQMSAAVLPEDATDSSVTWSVTAATGTATISETGLLTGTGVGTVTVKATANDGSEIEGTLVVTVTAA